LNKKLDFENVTTEYAFNSMEVKLN
jgi:hypothetical protein